ncbi:MAG: hypothetical protein EA417_18780, partial [Gammaproteobacteria bacterium]
SGRTGVGSSFDRLRTNGGRGMVSFDRLRTNGIFHLPFVLSLSKDLDERFGSGSCCAFIRLSC